MCTPKEYHKKNFAEMVCLRRKTPLKTPHGPFFKKGGGVPKPPTLLDSSETPLPYLHLSVKLRCTDQLVFKGSLL